MKVYLDNLATTPLDSRVLDEMLPLMKGVLANPHSTAHGFGAEASGVLEAARATIGSCLGVKASGVVLLPSATSANNLAVIGYGGAMAKRGRHILVSAVEHPSVLETAMEMGRRGFEVEQVPVGPAGVVDLERLGEMLRPETVMVSVMAVNNEVGAVQPLSGIAAMLEGRGTLLHCDAAQAAGKVDLNMLSGADMVTLSSHKAYGPVGVAALVIGSGRGRTLPEPGKVLFGGGQEGGKWPGTANVVGSAGLAKAMQLAVEDLDEDLSRIGDLSARLEAGLMEAFPGTVRNADRGECVPHCLSLRFAGVSGETLMSRLAGSGIGASFGSACATGSAKPSHVLTAMGIGADDARRTIRFGIGRMTTTDEIEYTLEVALELSKKLRLRGKAS